MKTDKPINVLFIDDDANVRDSLIGEARRKRLLIKGVDNLDDGLMELRANSRIKFIILDYKGFRHRGQTLGTDKGSFAVKAAEEIPRLSRELNRYLPFCFFTGFADLASDLSGADHTVIDKNEENATEKLFDHIWNTYLNSDEAILKNNFPDLFEAIEVMNSIEAESVLIKLLKHMQEIQTTDYKSVVTNVRSLQEIIYKAINQKNTSVIGNHHFENNGMVKFSSVKKHLSGHKDLNYKPTTQVYQNNAIENLTNSIYWSCSEYIHSDPQRHYYLSRYGLLSLINGVFEQLIWFKQLHQTI